MKIALYQVDNLSCRREKLSSLTLDLSMNVGHLRQEISNKFNFNLHIFQLYTMRMNQKIMMTDSWPLSFFLKDPKPFILLQTHAHEDSPSLKIEQLLANAVICIKNNDIRGLEKVWDEALVLDQNLINETYVNGWTLLHYSCYYGRESIVEILINQMWNCNQETEDGWTPLILACTHMNIGCVKLLLGHQSIQINKLTSKGTALHRAVELGDTEIVRLLLDNRACCIIEDNSGKIPLQLARNPEIIEMIPVYMGLWELEKYGVNPQTLPFMGELLLTRSYYLHDKIVQLKINLENGMLEEYDKIHSNISETASFRYKLMDIQQVKESPSAAFSTKKYFNFEIYYNKCERKYSTKNKDYRNEWISQLTNAIHYCQINKIGIDNDNMAFEEYEIEEDEDPQIDVRKSFEDSEKEIVSLASFEIIEEIGSGSFGTVHMVKKIDTGGIFAMKSLGKKMLKRQGKLKYAITECKLMKQLKHPYILAFYFAFQNTQNLYMVMEYCSEGDLENLLEVRGSINEHEARFYLAEIILALEYLHDNNILYRDLKPANVLLDSKGHIKLADFGIAKENVTKPETSATLVGSPIYMPPEVLKHQAVGKPSDLYSLGVMMYELLVGSPPFYSDDIEELFNTIKTAKLELPDILSIEAKDLIKKLMEKDPKKRVSIRDIKLHPFFKKIDWSGLLSRKYKSPNRQRCSFYSAEEVKLDLKELDRL